MKISVLLVIALLFFTGCTMPTKEQVYHPSRGEQLVNSTLAKTAKIIQDKYNLKPCGVGAAMPGGPIQELTLCFSTKYSFTREQLRVLLIKSAHELINQVTQNDEIQQLLKVRPFTIKNVEIIIYNQDKNGRTLYDPEILTAEISKAVLTYQTIEPNAYFKLKNEFEETYEDALKEVKE